jgi:hypothetical protein
MKCPLVRRNAALPGTNTGVSGLQWASSAVAAHWRMRNNGTAEVLS